MASSVCPIAQESTWARALYAGGGGEWWIFWDTLGTGRPYMYW